MASNVFVEALHGGVEVTLTDLASQLQIDLSSDVLGGVMRITQQCELLGLSLIPDVTHGDPATLRVLRGPYLEVDGRISQSLERGECARVEFKSSLLADVKKYSFTSTLSASDEVTHSVMKTICGFLNGDGGTLLIGVDDDGLPMDGLELDLKLKGWSEDKWLQFLDQEILTRFHDPHAVRRYVTIDIVSYQGLRVCICEVTPRSYPCFVSKDGKTHDFYIRNGARTDSLALPDFYAVMHERRLVGS